jgi:hypothetical protein
MNKSGIICMLSYYNKMGYSVRPYNPVHVYEPNSYTMTTHPKKNDNIYKQHPPVHTSVNNIYNRIRHPIYQLK